MPSVPAPATAWARLLPGWRPAAPPPPAARPAESALQPLPRRGPASAGLGGYASQQGLPPDARRLVTAAAVQSPPFSAREASPCTLCAVQVSWTMQQHRLESRRVLPCTPSAPAFSRARWVGGATCSMQQCIVPTVSAGATEQRCGGCRQDASPQPCCSSHLRLHLRLLLRLLLLLGRCLLGLLRCRRQGSHWPALHIQILIMRLLSMQPACSSHAAAGGLLG
jgi:hypothetical protein